MAHKAYLPYPVTKDWCERVHTALDGMGRGTQARLAEFLETKMHRKVSTGHLSEVLGCEYQTSDLVDPIHEFLGWPPSMPPTAILDADEIVHGAHRLDKEQREFTAYAMETLEGLSGEHARIALMEMLKVFRATRKND